MKLERHRLQRQNQEFLASYGVSELILMEYGIALAIFLVAAVGMASLLGPSLPEAVVHLVTGEGA